MRQFTIFQGGILCFLTNPLSTKKRETPGGMEGARGHIQNFLVKAVMAAGAGSLSSFSME
jgi:hypothetical protein